MEISVIDDNEGFQPYTRIEKVEGEIRIIELKTKNCSYPNFVAFFYNPIEQSLYSKISETVQKYRNLGAVYVVGMDSCDLEWDEENKDYKDFDKYLEFTSVFDICASGNCLDDFYSFVDLFESKLSGEITRAPEGIRDFCSDKSNFVGFWSEKGNSFEDAAKLLLEDFNRRKEMVGDLGADDYLQIKKIFICITSPENDIKLEELAEFCNQLEEKCGNPDILINLNFLRKPVENGKYRIGLMLY